MNPKQKSFLDDLAALIREYHIDYMNAEGGIIHVVSNGYDLSFESFDNDSDGGKFISVTSTEDYKPEDPPFAAKLYLDGELKEVAYPDDNFDD